jgi:EAL domain-containing protein (putative c-di-GMP-specific phosphodiesterase class I)
MPGAHATFGAPPDEAIARAVVELAHTFALHAVGEGVETAGHLAALRRLGCDRAQGFYFARPLPADETAVLLGSSPRW